MGGKVMKRNAKIRRLLTGIGATLCLLVGLLLPTSLVSADAVTVSVDAPATVDHGDYFTADIDISPVTDLNAGLFDVVFDSTVLAIDDITPGADITDGLISGTVIPVDMTSEVAPGRVRILLDMPGLEGATGEGYLCQIRFHAIGAAGTSSDIDLENGSLSDKYGDAIPATWVGTTVNIAGIPDISVSPTSKNFGDVTVGSSSPAQTFTVSNVGTADLVVGTIDITGANAGQFSKQNDNVSGQTIAPDGSATLEVVFSPTSTGAKSAALSIPSNDPDEATVAVPLSGNGVAAPVTDISVSPTSKNFGDVTVGSSSPAQTFTVSNVGTANLVVGTITITGANAGQFSKPTDNCSGQTITPGGSATLQVVFSPTSTGAKSAALSIPSNDPDEATVAVSLSGSGVSAPAPPPTGVGGTAYPPNKLLVLVPWIALGLAIIAGATIFMRRRRAQS
jgi:hypothetical protein